MRTVLPEKLTQGRMKHGTYGSSWKSGANGMFHVMGPCGSLLRIVASDGRGFLEAEGWEHVSVSTAKRPPNWQEMCFVKDLFWQPDECVVQFHPPEADYVNNHPHCLHLWRNAKVEFPRPPGWMVGVKDEGIIAPSGPPSFATSSVSSKLRSSGA